MTANFIDITQLEKGTEIVVETQNCLYTMEVLNPETAEVSIVGGASFPEANKAILEGSCRKDHQAEKQIIYEGSMIIRYKPKGKKRFIKIETDVVQSARIIGPENAWSYPMWG
jgi:hypothetical protein